jgi:hypothetical protein
MLQNCFLNHKQQSKVSECLTEVIFLQPVFLLEYLNIWVLEYLSTRVLEYLSTRILEYSNTRILKYSNTRILEYSNTRILEYSNTRILEYSNTRILEYSNTRILEYSNTRILNTWILEYFIIEHSSLFCLPITEEEKSFIKFVSARQPSLTVDHNFESCPHRFKKDASTSGTASIKLWGPGTVFTTLFLVTSKWAQ